MVGVAGFELATPCTPCKCATRLRYTPRVAIIASVLPVGVEQVAYAHQFAAQLVHALGLI